MDVSSLALVNQPLLAAGKTAAADNAGASGGFDAILNAYMGMINDTSALELQAEQLQLDYASGKTDDMLAVTLAQDKAYTMLSFTVQVTSKLIDAYREIMRIQL